VEQATKQKTKRFRKLKTGLNRIGKNKEKGQRNGHGNQHPEGKRRIFPNWRQQKVKRVQSSKCQSFRRMPNRHTEVNEKYRHDPALLKK